MAALHSATQANSSPACRRADKPSRRAKRARLAIGGALLAAAGAAGGAALQPVPAQNDRGAQLAATCAACHRLDGNDRGIPPIAGLSEERLVRAMAAYKSGTRTNLIMRAVARSLSDQEIAAVAHHFAALGRANGRR